ncbi:MAG: amidohydrolase family protein, partial [Deltaproteobacteria bacterium]|nr:amidohydrolase family protein [Deltaproteobacteria bacterium]
MEETIISSDSHVIEPPDLWEKGMPASLRDRAPKVYFSEKRDAWMFGAPGVQEQAVGALFMAGGKAEDREKYRRAGFSIARPGGWDPIARMADMATDGVCAEVLYPSLGLALYCIDDAAFQEALFRTYNDWMIDYCGKVPDRLYSIAMVSMYNVDHAIAEMERCKKAGMVGTMIWQVPDAKLPFTSEYYERFWAASAANDMPVHLHILTGFGDSMHRQTAEGIQRCRIGVDQTREIETALFDIIFTGALERYPKLKIVSVENEVGWIPFWLGQCDKAFNRHRHAQNLPIDKLPSEYFYN